MSIPNDYPNKPDPTNLCIHRCVKELMDSLCYNSKTNLIHRVPEQIRSPSKSNTQQSVPSANMC